MLVKTTKTRVCKAGMEHIDSTSTYETDINYNPCNTMSKRLLITFLYINCCTEIWRNLLIYIGHIQNICSPQVEAPDAIN